MQVALHSAALLMEREYYLAILALVATPVRYTTPFLWCHFKPAHGEFSPPPLQLPLSSLYMKSL